MAALVPCTACRRHVRRHETQCRFCGVKLVPSAPSARDIVIPRDAKRATIFALGLTLAGQACGGESDTPIYGAPTTPGVGASGGSGGGTGSGGSGASGNGGGANTAGNAGDSNIQAVYGAPVPPQPQTGGSGGGTGMPLDAGPADSGVADSGSDAAG